MLYKIGTMVRLTFSNSKPNMVGAEGVIIRFTDGSEIGSNIKSCYVVNYPDHLAYDGTTEWYSSHNQLEPIIKEKDKEHNQAVEWDDIWQPEKHHA